MMNVGVPREDQQNARVEDLWLSRDEEKRCQRGRGPWRLSQPVHFLGLHPGPSTAPEGANRPALSSPSLPPLPEFWSGVERNSTTLTPNFGGQVGTCSQVTQLSGTGAGGGVSSSQKHV